MSAKAILRKIYTEKRKGLGQAEIDRLSSEIAAKFSEIPLSGIKIIHAFYPIRGKLEVNSLLIVNELRNYHPEIKVSLPRSNPLDHSLEHIIWEDDTVLEQNAWGITEPLSGIEVKPEEIDLVLVPLLAYDVHGNRVGYGKGFYDRFLEKCREDVIKCGLSFFPPEKEITDNNQYDIAIDMCVAPNRIYCFK